ncbi:sensor histidine kinase [Herbiconiux sp. P18]|uniref:sensor histidine kinase n=1 Tax=Herbiconiux liangxiaofengii TaxID=3342795 RepID=UPI0035BA8EF0
MRTLHRLGSQTPPIVVDILLAALALAGGLLNFWRTTQIDTVLTVVGAAALLLRRRLPVPVFVLTLPSLYIGASSVATIIALYTVAALTRGRSRWGILLAAVVVFVGNTSFWFEWLGLAQSVPDIIYSAMVAAGPTALGLLTRTRNELANRVTELTALQDQERQRITDEVRAGERAQLAREMHDVVSHQVSLIAVEAGALQVRTSDPEVKGSAATIRLLASRTLEELRQMVSVLRGPADGGVSLSPQPTLDSVAALVDESGLVVDLELGLPDDLPLVVQRTLYHAVQEGLTNARKHAPGADVRVRGFVERRDLVLAIQNSEPTLPALDLPSARHGLVGLAERAALHGGSFSAGPTADGGFRVELRLPW